MWKSPGSRPKPSRDSHGPAKLEITIATTKITTERSIGSYFFVVFGAAFAAGLRAAAPVFFAGATRGRLPRRSRSSWRS